MTIEDEVNQLYQLPLADFTLARNALAKRAGEHAGDIRTLQKPNAAAWAVNQLYWQRRKMYDQLIAASERLRAAHAARLAGKPVDVSPVELAHRAALTAATEAALELLRSGGDPASPATLKAVTDTLDTLPGPEPAGRLTRPLQPMGFDALAGLIQKGGSAGKPPADVLAFVARRQPPKVSKAEQAARQAEAMRRDAAAVERDLRGARAAEREAETALSKARTALDRATQDRTRLEAELEKAASRVQQVRDDVNRAAKRARDAAAERERLSDRLTDLRARS